MRVNRWAGLVALLGVLLHAGLLVRHNSSVLAAALQLDPAFGVICGGASPPDTQGDTPDAPAPSKSGSKCPICMGAAPGAALLDAAAPVCHTPALSASRLAIAADTVTPRTPAAHPPSRAPPVTA